MDGLLGLGLVWVWYRSGVGLVIIPILSNSLSIGKDGSGDGCLAQEVFDDGVEGFLA